MLGGGIMGFLPRGIAMRTTNGETVDDYERSLEGSPPRRGRGGALLTAALVLLLLLVLTGSAGFYRYAYEPLRAHATLLYGDTKHLEKRAHDAEARAARLQHERDALAAERDRLQKAHDALLGKVQARDAQIEALQAAQQELQQKLGQEIANGDVQIYGGSGHLSVGLASKVLFPSGHADLSDRGKAILKRVAESLSGLTDRLIQVGGHTDGLPVSHDLEAQFPTNWELSTARATNVVRFLTEECSVPGQRLVASGFAQYRPVASNRTAAGRRRNRRIEITLLPMPHDDTASH